MIRVLIHGCSGKMGQVLAKLCKEDPEVSVVAGIDPKESETDYPRYFTVKEWDGNADVAVDFSHPDAVEELLLKCQERQMPLVLCTTGSSSKQQEMIRKTAEQIPVLWSSNMSLGMNLLFELVKTAAKTLADAGFDIEITEQHHNRKIDAPSGTAFALAEAMNQALGREYHYRCGRSGNAEKRDSKEIGIHAVRGGSIVGVHDVMFAGNDEVVTFRHTAYSKEIFAKGAIQAAKYLAGKPPGLYGMADVIKDRK